MGSRNGLLSIFKVAVLCSKRYLISPAKERKMLFKNLLNMGFLDVSVVKSPPTSAEDARDAGLIPDPGRSHMPQSN